MAEKLDQIIDDCFHLAWEEFGDDKSTEFLVQITADRLGIEPEEVYEALANCNDTHSPQETTVNSGAPDASIRAQRPRE